MQKIHLAFIALQFFATQILISQSENIDSLHQLFEEKSSAILQEIDQTYSYSNWNFSEENNLYKSCRDQASDLNNCYKLSVDKRNLSLELALGNGPLVSENSNKGIVAVTSIRLDTILYSILTSSFIVSSEIDEVSSYDDLKKIKTYFIESKEDLTTFLETENKSERTDSFLLKYSNIVESTVFQSYLPANNDFEKIRIQKFAKKYHQSDWSDFNYDTENLDYVRSSVHLIKHFYTQYDLTSWSTKYENDDFDGEEYREATFIECENIGCKNVGVFAINGEDSATEVFITELQLYKRDKVEVISKFTIYKEKDLGYDLRASAPSLDVSIFILKNEKRIGESISIESMDEYMALTSSYKNSLNRVNKGEEEILDRQIIQAYELCSMDKFNKLLLE